MAVHDDSPSALLVLDSAAITPTSGETFVLLDRHGQRDDAIAIVAPVCSHNRGQHPPLGFGRLPRVRTLSAE